MTKILLTSTQIYAKYKNSRANQNISTFTNILEIIFVCQLQVTVISGGEGKCVVELPVSRENSNNY